MRAIPALIATAALALSAVPVSSAAHATSATGSAQPHTTSPTTQPAPAQPHSTSPTTQPAAQPQSTSPTAGAAPTCAPVARDASALVGGRLTVSPMPGSRVASPSTQISLLGLPAREIGAVSVTGSRTGVHRGVLEPYSQGDGASFVPGAPFAEGERVSVQVQAGGGAPLRWSFQVAYNDVPHPPVKPGKPVRATAGAIQHFVSAPQLQPPRITVLKSAHSLAPGLLFVAPRPAREQSALGQSGPMIFDDSGQLVWFDPLPPQTKAANFAVQRYLGRPVLTWTDDALPVNGRRVNEDVIYDSSYRPVAQLTAGNGYEVNHHDFQITPAGTALITVFNPVRCPLVHVGGPADGAVYDGIMQEIDVKTGLVMFEWHSLDHVALNESYASARPSSADVPYDYFHINSTTLDPDGSLLVSARNTWAVYEVNAGTGQIAWRLAGKRSSFRMGRGTRTAWQHDARMLHNGLITVFDNGAWPPEHAQSRALVIRLDKRRWTATLVRALTHVPALLAGSQGDVQLLADGHWLVGWGQLPYLSEFAASGKLLFDARFPFFDNSYRAFRFRWSATPSEPPAVAVRSGPAGTLAVYASWNGATGAEWWKVLAGPAPGDLAPVALVRRTDFETAMSIPGAGHAYVEVQALDGHGRVLGHSAVAPAPPPNPTAPAPQTAPVAP